MLFSKSAKSIGYYKPFTDSIFHFEGNNMSVAYQLNFPLPVMSYEVFEADPFGNHSLGNHVYNINYDESQSHLFLEYMYKGEVYFTIFDKLNDAMHTYTYPMVKENCIREVFKDILGLYDSKLIFQCSPQDIPCLKEIFKEELSESPILKLNEIDEYDNNFLLLLQLL